MINKKKQVRWNIPEDINKNEEFTSNNMYHCLQHCSKTKDRKKKLSKNTVDLMMTTHDMGSNPNVSIKQKYKPAFRNFHTKHIKETTENYRNRKILSNGKK